ncbi:MAG: hypothetical protein ABSG86_25200 [Thermoguttaceae bacterium]
MFRCPCRCGPGCGECYAGEWQSDPPDCMDPCDGHGNWTGRGCSRCNNGPGYSHGPLPPAAINPEMVPGDAEPMPAGKPTPAPRPPQATRTGYGYPNGYAGGYPYGYGSGYGYGYGPGYGYTQR